MKPLSILCAFLIALISGGCADPLEQRTPEEIKSHALENETTNNPTGAPAASQTSPEYPPR
jgi:hypothetical protein